MEESVKKFKESEIRCASWLQQSISYYEHYERTISQATLYAYQSRISSQLQNLQVSHSICVTAAKEPVVTEESEKLMEEHFQRATKCLDDIASKLQLCKDTAQPDDIPQENDAAQSQQTSGTVNNLGSADAHHSDTSSSSSPSQANTAPVQPKSGMDEWIDELVIGSETKLPSNSSSHELAQVIARLEMQQDLPKVDIPKFDGSPILWPRFVEQFFVHVHSRPGLSDSRRMDLLQSHVTGEAKQLIQGLGYSGRNYAQSLKELKFAFGHKINIVRAFINCVISGNIIADGDSVGLRNFYVDVRDCIATLRQMNYTSELNNNDVLQRALSKIPYDKRSAWNDYICKIYNAREPSLIDLETWLKERVEADCSPYAVPLRSKSQGNPSSVHHESQQFCGHTTKTSAKCKQASNLQSCPACSGGHNLTNCTQYNDMNIFERFNFLK